MNKKMVTVTIFFAVAAACALPFVLKGYHTFQATLVLVYAIAPSAPATPVYMAETPKASDL